MIVQSRYSVVNVLRKPLLWQGCIALLFALVGFGVGGIKPAISAVLGGLVPFSGTAVFVLLGGFATRGSGPDGFLWRYGLAHLIKIAVVVGQLWLVFLQPQRIQTAWFLLAFVLGFLVYGVALLRAGRS